MFRVKFRDGREEVVEAAKAVPKGGAVLFFAGDRSGQFRRLFPLDLVAEVTDETPPRPKPSGPGAAPGHHSPRGR